MKRPTNAMKRLLFSLVFCLCLPLGSAGANVASPIRETLDFGHVATFSEFHPRAA